ncbi:MAG: hypothetical protein ACOYXB_08785 [Bacteroidota bacterium]
MKRLLILIPFLFSVFTAEAQNQKEIAVDTTTFVDDLYKYMVNMMGDQDKSQFDDFRTVWDSLPNAERVQIMEISNLMIRRNCRPKPQFTNYLAVLNKFYLQDNLSYGFDEWQQGYRDLVSRENTLLKQIDQVIAVTNDLLDGAYIYKGATVQWQARRKDFRFSFEKSFRVVFENIDIVCHASKDSIEIKDASGYLDPYTSEWIGSKGKVDWTRAGYQPEELYAEMKYYKISLKSAGYKADSVLLFYRSLFDKPMMGRLEDKVLFIKEPSAAIYPQFFTHQNSYSLPGFYDGINFAGGLSMQGANLAGTGSEYEPAILEIFSRDTLRIRLRSQIFLFNPQTIKTNSTELSIYLEKDSVYHPDLVFTYNISKQECRFTKSERYTSQGPYLDTYHKVDMNFDELYWKRDQPEMKMQAMTGTSIGRATFESDAFFNYDFYLSLQGMDWEHPLVQLWRFSEMVRGRDFSVSAYAANIGYDAYQIRHQLMAFAKLGFLYFDDKTDMVYLRQKLFDYIDASIRKRDYDVIRFISRIETGGENARLNLENKDMSIRGIPTIFLSDSQSVRLVPTGNTIIMKRNRNFQFSGSIDAGLFRFFGHNFFFDYNDFKINLQDIDSLQLRVKTGKYDSYGQAILNTIDNKIEKITGELQIDFPENKSGLKNYPEYPLFTSREKSYIFFDEAQIQQGVYKRDNFYFELDPFTIDSLDNFTREGMKLDGTFVSAEILPPLRLEMTLRDDNSLGFYLKTPSQGIPVYDAQGTFYNDIEMSSKGLHGYGSLDYVTSTTWSDDFLFHPDSVTSKSRKFQVRERFTETQFPEVENTVVDMRWMTRDKVMFLERTEPPFRMFKDTVLLRGDLALRPSGLSGSGLTSFPDGVMDSREFHYKAREILADSAGVKFKPKTSETYAFETDDVKVHVDFSRRQGEFTANADYTLVSFPDNYYETRLDRMNWFMDRDEVELTQKKVLDRNWVDIGIDTLRTNGPSYVSVHPKQDSLNFVAPLAVYNYRHRILNARKIPFIQVGDAYIFPAHKEVKIGIEAAMEKLDKARILANLTDRYHFIYDASLNIRSAKNYSGSGMYDYIDEFGTRYPFRFSEIREDTSLETRASGTITVVDSFRLSPYFEYQGSVKMNAKDRQLLFAGGVRPRFDCDISRNWFKFETRIDPDSVMIPVGEKMQNINLNNVYAGTLIARDSTHIYSTFLSGRKDYFDKNITSASGFLYFNKPKRAFEIGSREKLADNMEPGNYLRLDTDSCNLHGEGKIDMTLDFGQVILTAAGKADHDMARGELKMDLLLGMDFFFSEEALGIMGREIDSLPDLKPVDLSEPFYRLGVSDLVGKDVAEKLQREEQLYGVYSELPPGLKHTLFFNELPLEWNQETRSFRCNGTVGIGHIGNVQINKKVNAYIEMVEKGSGDLFDMYLMIDSKTWYYFAYSPGGLQVLSSNKEFNDFVFNLKVADRRSKAKPGQAKYTYSLAAQRRMELFLERFREYENRKAEMGN